ncbi:D-alanyl-D-alanine carboxypeptidase family protein [Oceanobacillus rekensis]|uniref:D-alanyl-D-alanine carboxypeptidase family protein n=1 Tax=Oceanobacillus rekensis TaxID=937927 RepID=UPI000B44D68D|nr:D-alanyl-D-alanine carboxypeptidase family protein [Oceanobacillus rekensis]
MFKKAIVACITISILFVMSACSAFDQTFDQSNEPPSNANSESEKDGQVSENDSQQDISIPEESLQKKDKGDQVLQLQSTLNQIGYDLTENGEFDDATTWAVTDFQLQQDSLLASGIYNESTKTALKDAVENNIEIVAGSGLPQEVEPAITDSGTPVIANPYDQLVLVNKQHALPADYMPRDLVIPDVRFPFTEDLPKKQMRKEAATALEELFIAADGAGLELFAQSGFRSYERQDAIFASNSLEHGEEEANIFSARPGESEHQTGLTMDVTSPKVNFELITEFGETEEGKWIQGNAAEYGFIIRFPEGKEEITKYQYEPWHLRFVGKKAASEIMSQDITLEEYLKVSE